MSEETTSPEENNDPEENQDLPIIDPEKLRQKFEMMSEMGLFPTPKNMGPGKVYVVNFETGGEASFLLERLDPSLYQPREQMESEFSTIKALAEDIQKVGLLYPILVRLKLDENMGDPESCRFEILGGYRRVEAFKRYLIDKSIQVKIYIVTDLEAHHIAISDNLQRKQFTVVEELKALANLADQHLQEKAWEYPMEEENPIARLYQFLSQLSGLKTKKDRGEEGLGEKEPFYNRNIVEVEEIFTKLPKSLNWRGFFTNDLVILQNADELILKRATQFSLNKQQIKAYQKIYQVALKTDQLEAFHQLENLKEKSGRELLLIAKQFENKARRSQRLPSTTHSKNAMIHWLNRLGHTQVRIAEKLELSVSNVNSKINSNTFPLLIRQELQQGKSSAEIAATYQCPESLILDIILEGKSEVERLDAIHWEIKTQARWNWAKGDLRFAEKEDAEIQPQLIAHLLYYFVPENALLMEAIAESPMVSLVCLSLNRHCISLAPPEKTKEYLGLFPHFWTDPLEWVQGWSKLPDAIYLKQNQYWPAHQLESFFELARENSNEQSRLLYLHQERFEGDPPQNNLDLFKVLHLLDSTGWSTDTWIDCSNNIYQPKKEEREQLLIERKIVGNRRTLIVATSIPKS